MYDAPTVSLSEHIKKNIFFQVGRKLAKFNPCEGGFGMTFKESMPSRMPSHYWLDSLHHTVLSVSDFCKCSPGKLNLNLIVIVQTSCLDLLSSSHRTMLPECCCMKDSFGSSLQRNHNTCLSFVTNSSHIFFDSLHCRRKQGRGVDCREAKNVRKKSASLQQLFTSPQLFNACYAGYLFCHFKYSYKEVLWQASWTFTGWHY